RPVAAADAGGRAIDFYQPWRDALLTDEQRLALRDGQPAQLSKQALARLHGLSAAQPTSWLADPLGLWTSWWSQRAHATAARPRGGLLWIAAPTSGPDWAVL